MRISEDIAVNLLRDYKPWNPIRPSIIFKVGPDPEDDSPDYETLYRLVQALRDAFPITRETDAGNTLVRADVYEGHSECTGYALRGTGCHWIAIPTGAINRIRWSALMTMTDPVVREILSLDDFPDAFTLLLPEIIVWLGLEFIIAHELGHIVKGHTRKATSDTDLQIARELDADQFSAIHLATSISNAKLHLNGLPEEIWQFPEHYHGMFALLSVFTILSYWTIDASRKNCDKSYPEMDVRLCNFVNAYESTYSKNGRIASKSNLTFRQVKLSSQATKRLIDLFPSHARLAVTKNNPFELFDDMNSSMDKIEICLSSSRNKIENLNKFLQLE